MSDLASFGEWIRRRRRALDLTRAALAGQVGCALVTLRKIETDERRPSRQVAERLAACLQIPAEQQAAFLEAARGARAVDRLPALSPPQQPVLIASAPGARAVGAPTVESPRPSAPGSATPAQTRPTHNLPAQLTTLLGREDALEELGGLLERPEVRLVTITGPGGSGKTRLALQASVEQLGRFPDGAWFVDLAAIQQPDLILPALARSLGLAETTELPLREHLIADLQRKRLLLLLDNFEHIIDGAVELSALLAGAPYIKALVTSRAPLNLRGEHCYALAPLALPPQATPELLMAYPATALFIERAQAIRQSFRVTDTNAPIIASICTQLDGLPLAIELAAARMSLFTPELLLARLERPLALLTRGARDLPPRQQTLRNVIGWSYQLLDADDQRLFRRLGVFNGSGALEQIEAVCVAQQERDATLERLEALTNHGLVRMHETSDIPRFAMLETIRAYALELLDAHHERDALELRHAEAFCAFAEQADGGLLGSDQAEWANRLEREYPNLRAALAWSQRAGAARGLREELGLRLIGSLGRFWHSRGYWVEGYQWLAAIFALPMQVPQTVAGARALRTAGLMRYAREEFEAAHGLYTQSLTICRALDEHVGIADSLWLLGRIAFAREDVVSARVLFEECLRHYRALGDLRGCAATLNLLGDIASCDSATLDLAQALYEESLSHARTAGAVGTAAFVLGNLGRLAKSRGALAEASARYRESLAIARAIGNQATIIWMLERLGELTTQQGEYATAHTYLDEGLAIAEGLRSNWGIGSVLRGLGVLAEREGRLVRAAELYRESAPYFVRASAMTMAIDVLALLARTLGACGQATQAARLLGAAVAAAQARGLTIDAITPDPASDYPIEAAAVAARLSPDEFATAWAAGLALSLEQAVTDAQTT